MITLRYQEILISGSVSFDLDCAESKEFMVDMLWVRCPRVCTCSSGVHFSFRPAVNTGVFVKRDRGNL